MTDGPLCPYPSVHLLHSTFFFTVYYIHTLFFYQKIHHGTAWLECMIQGYGINIIGVFIHDEYNLISLSIMHDDG